MKELVKLPELKLEYIKVKSDTAYGYFHSWTASLEGTGMVVEAGSKEEAIRELMKSIEVELLYDYEQKTKP